jgi:hypothetical protein
MSKDIARMTTLSFEVSVSEEAAARNVNEAGSRIEQKEDIARR